MEHDTNICDMFYQMGILWNIHVILEYVFKYRKVTSQPLRGGDFPAGAVDFPINGVWVAQCKHNKNTFCSFTRGQQKQGYKRLLSEM